MRKNAAPRLEFPRTVRKSDFLASREMISPKPLKLSGLHTSAANIPKYEKKKFCPVATYVPGLCGSAGADQRLFRLLCFLHSPIRITHRSKSSNLV